MPELDSLLEEEVLLQRSLDDLDREHAAGEIDDDAYAALRAQYESRVAHVAGLVRDAAPSAEGAGGSGSLAPDGWACSNGSIRRPERRERGRWLRTHRRGVGWASVGCFAAAALFASLAFAGVPPFSSPPSTLSTAARIRIELGEAGVLAANHNVSEAVAVYDQVLAIEPRQPEALANAGWLLRLAGTAGHDDRLVRAGDTEIGLAVTVAPGYALARAYDGTAAYEDGHDPGQAARQFTAMLQDHPTLTLLRSVRPYAVAAFRAAGKPLPPALASA